MTVDLFNCNIQKGGLDISISIEYGNNFSFNEGQKNVPLLSCSTSDSANFNESFRSFYASEKNG